MKPIGPLMREHRLIERMLALLERESKIIASERQADSSFIDKAVDFFEVYVDWTHHGKEEDIYFKKASDKAMSLEHRRIMNELIEEHRQARKLIKDLKKLNSLYKNGESSLLNGISTAIDSMNKLYPAHIEKEDKHFFFPSQELFSKEEQNEMLAEYDSFDAKMIYLKYTELVDEL
ncbi:MAG: hemerythrin domain-containing protein [Actinobacteria bacterium]|nr:hemerythrin domain-containing protein [Actinomycetota bacterium]